MASPVCAASMAHVFSRRALRFCPIQRRWAQVQDIRFRDLRFLATQNTQDRILAKYREQLEKKAQEEGHQSLDSLQAAYQERIQTLRKKAIVPGATGPLDAGAEAVIKPASDPASFVSKGPSPPPPPPTVPKSPPTIKTLSSYLDLSKVSSLPASEIPNIWRLRHASDSTSLSFTLPTDTWKVIASTARKHPQFILPLPRDNDAIVAENDTAAPATADKSSPIEIHFLQFGFPAPDAVTLLFTNLAEYKLRGEYSSPHTTITFYTELSDSHGLVLGQGTVLEGRGVTVEEGRWLLMCLQKFYGVQAEKERGGVGRKILEKFTSGDSSFSVEDLVEEAERI